MTMKMKKKFTLFLLRIRHQASSIFSSAEERLPSKIKDQSEQ